VRKWAVVTVLVLAVFSLSSAICVVSLNNGQVHGEELLFGSIESMEMNDPNTMNVTFNSFSWAAPYAMLQVYVQEGSNNRSADALITDPLNRTLSPSSGALWFNATIHDLNGDGCIQDGEFVVLISSEPFQLNEVYWFGLISKNTGNELCNSQVSYQATGGACFFRTCKD
jgi:hypothetical protein